MRYIITILHRSKQSRRRVGKSETKTFDSDAPTMDEAELQYMQRLNASPLSRTFAVALDIVPDAKQPDPMAAGGQQ